MIETKSKVAVDLNVYVQGKGFPILCLHGHPGSGRSLSVFTQHLSQRFNTLAPDLRGYGNSPAQSNFSMTDHLVDLEALLERFQVDRCLVLGWSLGGILAMELALKLPERVSGLILIATAARPRSNHPPISWQDNFYTAVASILNRLQPSWQWNIDTFGKRSLYRYLIQQHTPTAEVEITHLNLNDQTVAGLRHKSLPVFSVQYHPEASPGPHDADYLFEQFVQAMRESTSTKT